MIFYIILKKNFNLNQDSTKEILEKIPYLNEKIYKVKLEEKHLKIFTKFIKQSEKIRIIKKINLLIKNLHNLQDITKREIIFENKNSIISNIPTPSKNLRGNSFIILSIIKNKPRIINNCKYSL